MPIRIMHVVNSLGQGGLENGLVNLIGRMDPVGFEHSVYTLRSLGPNLERLPLNRVKVVCLGLTGARSQARELVRAIRQYRPDIVHSRNWGAIEAVLAARWVGSCAVVHGEHGLETDASVAEPWRRIAFRRVAFELADRVLSVSYQLRELHAQRTGFSKDRIAVFHNGVDSLRFSPDATKRAHSRRELGLTDDDFCIGCVGNLLPVKDHLTLVQAAAGMGEAGVRWRLVIIGEGPERPRLEAFLNNHPAWKDRVMLLGSRIGVPDLLRSMDVYVLPSKSEGISNSLLEAMATGLPVAATRVGGNPEVVIDGESGLLFPAGDTRRLTDLLLLLESNRDLRERLGQAAQRRIRDEFAVESMVARYEELYESLRPATASVRAVARV
jgi:sugar transferase (PEP-CTERM/EpsH1 system associated)